MSILDRRIMVKTDVQLVEDLLKNHQPPLMELDSRSACNAFAEALTDSLTDMIKRYTIEKVLKSRST